MTSKQEKTPLENSEQQTRFYLIFKEFAKVDPMSISDVSLEELDDIEQVRRMVMDVTDDQPIFMTST
jgi:hypothetical protein